MCLFSWENQKPLASKIKIQANYVTCSLITFVLTQNSALYIKYVTTIHKIRLVWRWRNVTSFILADLKSTGHIFSARLLLYLCMLCFIYLFIYLALFLRAIFYNFLCNWTRLSGNLEIFLIKAGSPALHFLFWCHMNGNFKFPLQYRH